eukprot:1105242-Rhodomonas_salina.1
MLQVWSRGSLAQAREMRAQDPGSRKIRLYGPGSRVIRGQGPGGLGFTVQGPGTQTTSGSTRSRQYRSARPHGVPWSLGLLCCNGNGNGSGNVVVLVGKM